MGAGERVIKYKNIIKYLFLPLLFFNNTTRLSAFVTFITAMIPSFIYKTEVTESAALWCTLTIFQLLLTAYIVMR